MQQQFISVCRFKLLRFLLIKIPFHPETFIISPLLFGRKKSNEQRQRRWTLMYSVESIHLLDNVLHAHIILLVQICSTIVSYLFMPCLLLAFYNPFLFMCFSTYPHRVSGILTLHSLCVYFLLRPLNIPANFRLLQILPKPVKLQAFSIFQIILEITK